MTSTSELHDMVRAVVSAMFPAKSSSLFDVNHSIPRASACGSPGGTILPVNPSLTTSRNPPTSVASTGLP
jgi:hypothetical protein